MLRVTLVLEKANRVVRRIDLRRARMVVGRQLGCDVRIPSAEVSRRHCLFVVGDNDCAIEDLNSVNGTYVNEIAVIGRQSLNPGDRVQIGPLTFVVEFAPLPKDLEPKRQDSATKEPTTKRPQPGTRQPKTPAARSSKENDYFSGEHISRGERGKDAQDLEDVLEEIEELPEVAAEPNEQEDVFEDVEVILDDDEPLLLPENGELRGILSQLTDSDHPATPRKP
jgi:pSer/pThr/pTyr-binding forkhead associated (FHA) protein